MLTGERLGDSEGLDDAEDPRDADASDEENVSALVELELEVKHVRRMMP